jgi:hypothetical protein
MSIVPAIIISASIPETGGTRSGIFNTEINNGKAGKQDIFDLQ